MDAQQVKLDLEMKNVKIKQLEETNAKLVNQLALKFEIGSGKKHNEDDVDDMRKNPTSTKVPSIKDPNLRELPADVKPLVEKDSKEFIVTGDGPCLLRTTAAHMYGDEEEWPQLARDLNTHQALYRGYWEDKISADFPCTITVGVNGETKELANSTEYFDWLQESRSAAYLLMSCIDVMALKNMNIDIIIHENGLSPAIQKYEPDLEFPWKEEDPMKPQNLNVKKQRKMTVLNHKNVHFNLIVGPKQMLSQVGSLRFQQTQFPLDPEG